MLDSIFSIIIAVLPLSLLASVIIIMVVVIKKLFRMQERQIELLNAILERLRKDIGN